VGLAPIKDMLPLLKLVVQIPTGHIHHGTKLIKIAFLCSLNLPIKVERARFYRLRFGTLMRAARKLTLFSRICQFLREFCNVNFPKNHMPLGSSVGRDPFERNPAIISIFYAFSLFGQGKRKNAG
jgi:hypothetical protein